MTCNDGGSSNLTWNIKEGETRWSWADFADETNGLYKDLSAVAKNALYEATALTEGSQIEMAAKRHDICVAHYGWSSFMKNSSGVARVSSSLNSATAFNTTESGNMTYFIAIICLVSLSVVTGFFFIRRRK